MLDKSSTRILNKNKLKFRSNLKGKIACLKALKLIKARKFKNILLYAPLSYEPDILAFRRILSNKGVKLFLPFMLDKSLKIVKLRLPFFKGRFNVRQAADSKAITPKLDAALIPVIGVDNKMRRIGHGQGFYDRFFATLNYKPCVIFISSQDLFVNSSICDPYDIIGDFYVTPKNSRTNYDRNHHRISSQ